MSSSDRSRTSDDRRYHYKAVVAQQGRVIVDRDLNALETILIERADADVLAIVGPAGTPDNGFEISVPPLSPPAGAVSPSGSQSFDFTVGPGTMYVGGQRVEFPAAIDAVGQTYSYYSQPDWLQPNDPVPQGSPPTFPEPSSPPTGVEVTWLDLFNQEAEATEDPDLKEVALGGPDTSARVRLMCRVRRTPVHETDCAGAWLEATDTWSSESGVAFDPDTMQLRPEVRLQVSFQQDPASGDLCDPVARGGYLYAYNQLLRIQISAAALADGTPARFLWSYDNASFLYRISSVTASGTQLQLADSPPDAFHFPKSGQVVEILRTAVVLGTAPDANNPDASIVRCIAEATGQIRTLSQAYGATTQGGTANYLTFTDPLPPEYLSDTNPLFVRIWQSEQDYPGNVAGVALQDGTNGTTNGVVVTLTTPPGVPMTVGAFWMVAVRPGTPQAVYPERFLNGPQPPDGPARWACPLATIDWTTQPPTVTDCRSPFDNLVTLSKRKPGCCTVSLRPEDLSATRTLQKVIDAAVATADTVKICFGPGAYFLPESLRLGPLHEDIVLEACTEGAWLRPAPNADPALFRDGLLVLADAPGITLSGLNFQSVDVPVTKLIEEDLTIFTRIMAIEVQGFKGLKTLQFQHTGLWNDPERVLTTAVTNLSALISVRSVRCTDLTVESCYFSVLAPRAQQQRWNSLAIGLLAQGDSTGLAVRNCTFSGTTGVASPGLVATSSTLMKASNVAGLALQPAAAPAAAAGKTTASAKKAASTSAAAKTAAAKKLVNVSQAALDASQLLVTCPISPTLRRLARQRPRAPRSRWAWDCWLLPGSAKRASSGRARFNFGFGLESRLANAEVSGNVFSYLTLAAASVAQTGIVRVADNTVSECAAGLWFATWHNPLIQWNPSQPLTSGRRPTACFMRCCAKRRPSGLFAPMLLALPPGRIRDRAPAVAAVAPALTLTGNDIDCTFSGPVSDLTASSLALAIFTDELAPRLRDTTLTIAANHLQSRPPTIYPTVFAACNGNLAMTGNQIANTQGVEQSQSLLLDIDGVRGNREGRSAWTRGHAAIFSTVRPT